jgi:hypothetical protein
VGGDDGPPPDPAEATLVGEAVDRALARADPAGVGQQLEGVAGPIGQHAGARERERRRLVLCHAGRAATVALAPGVLRRGPVGGLQLRAHRCLVRAHPSRTAGLRPGLDVVRIEPGRRVIEETRVLAIEIQIRLKELQAERLLASSEGLAGNAAYMADLEGEIAELNDAYVGAAVTEIATLRAALFGPQVG